MFICKERIEPFGLSDLNHWPRGSTLLAPEGRVHGLRDPQSLFRA
jgi:hypothetical protein